MDIIVENPENPEHGRHRILTLTGFAAAYRTMVHAGAAGKEVLFTITGPDSEEAADRIHELMELGYAPLGEMMGGFLAQQERVLRGDGGS